MTPGQSSCSDSLDESRYVRPGTSRRAGRSSLRTPPRPAPSLPLHLRARLIWWPLHVKSGAYWPTGPCSAPTGNTKTVSSPRPHCAGRRPGRQARSRAAGHFWPAAGGTPGPLTAGVESSTRIGLRYLVRTGAGRSRTRRCWPVTDHGMAPTRGSLRAWRDERPDRHPEQLQRGSLSWHTDRLTPEAVSTRLALERA